MAQKNSQLIKALALATGLASIGALAKVIKENTPIQAGKALKLVQADFARRGPVLDSWIHYTPTRYQLIEEAPMAYLGGLSVKEDQQVIHYQFACDIFTGEVLDYFMVKSISE
ncbi:hypothetical protein [Hutsoniella sourekii]|uniref:hypothetical protein n=1 Tax=Hutsoniella sourekii TaxID=87650 RepID=UPI0004B635E3|nr:hypothetical protein [Hutsoniella sourekii]